MNRALMAVPIILCLLGASPLLVAADTASDAERVKQQTPLIPDLKKAAVTASGYDSSGIGVSSTAHRIVITVADSKLLQGTSGEREQEASKIASAVAATIAGKPQFDQVMIIRVDYVKRQGSNSKVISSIDFAKDPTGAFRHHVS